MFRSFERTTMPPNIYVIEHLGTIFAYGQTGTGKTYTMEGQWWTVTCVDLLRGSSGFFLAFSNGCKAISCRESEKVEYEHEKLAGSWYTNRRNFSLYRDSQSRFITFEPKVVQISARNTKVYKICEICKAYFPHFTTFRDQTSSNSTNFKMLSLAVACSDGFCSTCLD